MITRVVVAQKELSCISCCTEAIPCRAFAVVSLSSASQAPPPRLVFPNQVLAMALLAATNAAVVAAVVLHGRALRKQLLAALQAQARAPSSFASLVQYPASPVCKSELYSGAASCGSNKFAVLDIPTDGHVFEPSKRIVTFPPTGQ